MSWVALLSPSSCIWIDEQLDSSFLFFSFIQVHFCSLLLIYLVNWSCETFCSMRPQLHTDAGTRIQHSVTFFLLALSLSSVDCCLTVLRVTFLGAFFFPPNCVIEHPCSVCSITASTHVHPYLQPWRRRARERSRQKQGRETERERLYFDKDALYQGDSHITGWLRVSIAKKWPELLHSS